MSKDTSRPAFPSLGGTPNFEKGMTLRQWYAGMAMQRLVTDDDGYSIQHVSKVLGIDSVDYDPAEHWPQYVALRAWKFADAMLAQEEQEAASGD